MDEEAFLKNFSFDFSFDHEKTHCLKSWEEKRREVPTWCPPVFDGILCWPPTAPGTNASQPCRSEINGIFYDTSYNASKECTAEGAWNNYSNYDECSREKFVGIPSTSEEVEITTIIYSIGYSLSLVTLSLALFIFLYFKDLRCLRNTIHTNLMFTYVAADFMWILSLSVSMHTDSFSCLILFTLLHYFTLTNFFWMFVEGLYLYMLVVETFQRENIKLRAYLMIGWGTPVLVILIWLIARSNYDDVIDESDGRGTCKWMRPSDADWIYQIPAVAVLGINIIFLTCIMWVLITKLRSANSVETEQYRKGCKALLVLIPLLGVTYILFIWGPVSSIYNIIRAILLSTQGLMVGLLYCFVNTEVQNAMKHRWERWREARSLNTRAYTKDSSPNTRTESIRLYSRHEVTPYRKRESTGSEATTMTLVHGCHRPSNGPRSPFLQPPSEPV